MSALSHSSSAVIKAPLETIWGLLVDVDSWATWNSTIVTGAGTAGPGSTVKVTTTLDPKRTFSLKVKEFTPHTRMVWTSGNFIFGGERVYTLTEVKGGVKFSMEETFSGLFKGPISKSIPDMTEAFATFAKDLKVAAESQA